MRLTNEQLDQLLSALDDWVQHCNVNNVPRKYAIPLAQDLQREIRLEKTYQRVHRMEEGDRDDDSV